MANTIPDIIVPSTNFVSINTLSGIVVGNAMTFQNKGSVDLYIVENTTQPAATVTDGLILSHFNRAYSTGGSTTGSNEIWVKSVSGTGKLHVEVGV